MRSLAATLPSEQRWNDSVRCDGEADRDQGRQETETAVRVRWKENIPDLCDPSHAMNVRLRTCFENQSSRHRPCTGRINRHVLWRRRGTTRARYISKHVLSHQGRRWFRHLLSEPRKANRKTGVSTVGATGLDGAAVKFNDPPAFGKSKPQAAAGFSA